MTATYRGGALPVLAYCRIRPVLSRVEKIGRDGGGGGENDRFFFWSESPWAPGAKWGSLLWRWWGVRATVDLVQRKSILLEAQVVLETQRMKTSALQGHREAERGSKRACATEGLRTWALSCLRALPGWTNSLQIRRLQWASSPPRKPNDLPQGCSAAR